MTDDTRPLTTPDEPRGWCLWCGHRVHPAHGQLCYDCAVEEADAKLRGDTDHGATIEGDTF